MTTLKRVLIVLLAAALVAAGAYALVQNTGSSPAASGAPSFERGAPPAGQTTTGAAANFPARPGGDHFGNEAGGAGGLADIGKNLGIFGALFVGAAGLSQALGFLNRRRPAARPDPV